MACVKILPANNLQDQIDALNAGILVVTMDCTADEVVGDIVRLSAATPNLVERTVNNTVDRPAIGVIIEKISAVVARVAVKGVIDYVIAIGRVYLDTDGKFTLVSPSNSGGFRQALGYSFGNGKLNLDPELKLTLNA